MHKSTAYEELRSGFGCHGRVAFVCSGGGDPMRRYRYSAQKDLYWSQAGRPSMELRGRGSEAHVDGCEVLWMKLDGQRGSPGMRGGAGHLLSMACLVYR